MVFRHGFRLGGIELESLVEAVGKRFLGDLGLSPAADEGKDLLDSSQRSGPFRMRTATVIVLVLCACAPTPGTRSLPGLPVGVTVRSSEQPYNVAGSTIGEISRSLRTGGNETFGRRLWGFHSYDLQWNWRYAQETSRCEVTEVTIELTSDITLPRWTGREDSDSTVAAAWDTFIAVLRNHEYCHRVLAYQAARELSRRIQRIEATTCGSLISQVRLTGRSILDQHKRLNAEYDELSRGYLRWPPDSEEKEAPICPLWR